MPAKTTNKKKRAGDAPKTAPGDHTLTLTLLERYRILRWIPEKMHGLKAMVNIPRIKERLLLTGAEIKKHRIQEAGGLYYVAGDDGRRRNPPDFSADITLTDYMVELLILCARWRIDTPGLPKAEEFPYEDFPLLLRLCQLRDDEYLEMIEQAQG